MPNLSPLAALFRLRPDRAADYLAAKGFKLSGPYWEMDGPQHSHLFTVANLAKMDVLQDIRSAVQQALDEGHHEQWFAEQLVAVLQRKGWWGGKDGSLRRLHTIYATNLQTALMAGRHRQAMEQIDRAPWAQYMAIRDHRSRPAHAAMHGQIFRLDSPAWAAISPPCGYSCRCSARYLSDRELEKRGLKPAEDVQILEREPPGKKPVNPLTGASPERWIQRGVSVPDPLHPGERLTLWADPGWDNIPGSDGAERALVDRLLAKATDLGDGVRMAVQAGLQEVAEKVEKAAAVATVTGVFEAQTTAKKAAQWAMEQDLTDLADYTGVKPEVANAWNRSLYDHVTQFPALRGNQQFTGAAQAQFKQYRTASIDRLMLRLKTVYPELDDATLRARAERAVKIKRVAGDTYAHSWDQPGVRGVAVNAKWGKDATAFNAHLERDVTAGWHPQGTASIKAVVDHELGHQLDTLLDLDKDAAMLALWAKGKPFVGENLSRYAMKNIKEMIAEGWAEYRNNPNPRAMAKQIGEIIESRYRYRYPA